jgi:molecular chaperone DnaK (HSP70)
MVIKSFLRLFRTRKMEVFPFVIAKIPYLIIFYSEILVGYEAIPQLSKHPKNTIYNAKRFIGRRYFFFIVSLFRYSSIFFCDIYSLEEEQVRIYAEEHPFQVVPSSLSNFSKVGFEIEKEKGTTSVITPEQVGTEVLKHLLRITADYLGHKQVNKAVIAVPAKFDANQRQATGEAYRKAGLKVMRVIEEPTAAAVAYKLHKKKNIHHILVYDFGGGTLDVSLLYVAKGSVQVYATDGDETLGGSDFDLCLAKNFKKKVESLSGEVVVNEHSNHQLDQLKKEMKGTIVQEDELCIFPSIHTKAEEIKKSLTYEDEAKFSCILPVREKPFFCFLFLFLIFLFFSFLFHFRTTARKSISRSLARKTSRVTVIISSNELFSLWNDC